MLHEKKKRIKFTSWIGTMRGTIDQVRQLFFSQDLFIVLNYVYVWVCAHEYRHLYCGSQRHQVPMELEV